VAIVAIFSRDSREFGIDLGNRTDFTGRVRFWAMAVVAGLLAFSGCARAKTSGRAGAPTFGATTNLPPDNVGSNPKPIITPEVSHTGKVARLNVAGQFVVLSFPVGYLPPSQQSLSVYRAGLKVGEVRVTEWRRDENVVADIVAGEAQAGDEIRER